MEIVDLTELEGRGPAWGTASEELNATLLVWRAGEGQPEHVNEGRDVAVVLSPDEYQRLRAADAPKVNPVFAKLHEESHKRWSKVYEALAK
jgi:hypothetical protein